MTNPEIIKHTIKATEFAMTEEQQQRYMAFHIANIRRQLHVTPGKMLRVITDVGDAGEPSREKVVLTNNFRTKRNLLA